VSVKSKGRSGLGKTEPKKSVTPEKPSPGELQSASLWLQGQVSKTLAFHSSRIADGLDAGASGVEFWEDAAHNLGKGIARAVLDSFLDHGSKPTLAAIENLVNLTTGMPRALALVQRKGKS